MIQTTLIDLGCKKTNFKEIKGPFNLPKGWKWVRLGDVVKEERTQIKPWEFPERKFWLVTMDCVESNSGELTQKVEVKGKEIKSVKFVFNSKHILYGKLRPYLNKVFTTSEGEGICTTEFIPLLPKEFVNKEYLAWLLRTEYVVKYAMSHLTGARQPRVDMNSFYRMPIPIPFRNGKPDLEEQKRIVAKIEALFQKLDRVKELRRQAKKEAEELLQAALHKVFSRADEERWKWVRLGNICEIKRNTIYPMNYPEEYFELYSIPSYHQKGEPEILKGKEIKSSKYIVKPGYVLYGRLNPHVPKVWIVSKTSEKRQISSTEFFPITINPSYLCNKYLYWFFKTNIFQNIVKKLVQGATGSRKRVDLNHFKKIKIPLPFRNGKPDLEEQKRIVTYLDNIAEKQRKLLKLYEDTEKEIEEMRQAILSKAFRGEL